MSFKFLKIYIIQIAPQKKGNLFFKSIWKIRLFYVYRVAFSPGYMINDHLESKRVHLKSLPNHFSPSRFSELDALGLGSFSDYHSDFWFFWYFGASGMLFTSLAPCYLWTWVRNPQMYVNTDYLLWLISWRQCVDLYHRKTIPQRLKKEKNLRQGSH